MTQIPMNNFQALISQVDWEKCSGMIPAIVQDVKNHTILMLGFMNQDALQLTIDSGLVSFYSRTRQKLWTKGETSSNTLEVVDLILDCDHDSILVLANPNGPTCHTGEQSCFQQKKSLRFGFFSQLESIIESRKKQDPNSSYTASLFHSGINRICQKVGEEGVETALAGATNSANLIEESADLLYHLLVLLQAKNLSLEDVESVLRNRHSATGDRNHD